MSTGRAPKGSGGKGRRRLSGRGPTPPAEQRPGHPAQRRAAAQARREQAGRPSRGSEAGGAGTGEVIVGRHPVMEALRAGAPGSQLLLAVRGGHGEKPDQLVEEARRLAARRGIPEADLARPELDRLAGGAAHQGIGLRMPPYRYLHPDDLLARANEASAPALLVALDGVTDPHNLGSIARSTAAFGGHGLLVPERRAAGVTAAAWKASAGALARLPVARATNLVRALQAYSKAGLLVVGLDVDADLTLEEFEAATDPLVLVVGAEGRGLSRLVAETCDLRVKIALPGPVESLNVGVAAGVALAELARRRRTRIDGPATRQTA